MIKQVQFPLEKNLENLDTIELIDNSLNSDNYFNVSKLKKTYGLGYHSIIIKGSSNLRKFSAISFEAYDSYGFPIKCRVRGNNLYIGSTQSILSFLIENIHSNGEAFIVLAGTTKDYSQDRNDPNIIWKYKFAINKNINNDDDLIFRDSPNFDLQETANGIVNELGQEVTIANITCSNLYPFSGRVDGVSLYTRLSNTTNDFSLSTIYRLRGSSYYTGTFVDSDVTEYVQYSTTSQITNEINNSNIYFDVPLVIITKPTYYDMKMIFYDGKDELCRDQNGRTFELIKQNIPVSGIGEGGTLQYDNVIGAPNVQWANSPIPGVESGSLGTNNSTIELTWTDLKLLKSSQFPINSNDIYGIPKNITYAMGTNVQKYAVWMFVTEETGYTPYWQYPGKVVLYNQTLFNQSLFDEKSFPSPDSKGYWYFKGWYATNYASIDVVKGKTYSFWVGFVTRKTLIPTLQYMAVDESQPTSDIQYREVIQYVFGDNDPTWS